MNKYDNLKIWKQTKARVNHSCINCEKQINVGELYYAEELKDKFLHSLHRKKLCNKCYQELMNK
jgi:hypothetical protein